MTKDQKKKLTDQGLSGAYVRKILQETRLTDVATIHYDNDIEVDMGDMEDFIFQLLTCSDKIKQSAYRSVVTHDQLPLRGV